MTETVTRPNELRFNLTTATDGEQLLTLIDLLQPLTPNPPATRTFLLHPIGQHHPLAREPFLVNLPDNWQKVSRDRAHLYYDANGNPRVAVKVGPDEFVEYLTLMRRLIVVEYKDGRYGVYDSQKRRLIVAGLTALHACAWLRYFYPKYDDPAAYWNKRLYPHVWSLPLLCAAWYTLAPR